MVSRAITGLENYRNAIKADEEQRSVKEYQVWWEHDDRQGTIWEATTQIRKFLKTVEPGCVKSEFKTECKEDLIKFGEKYCPIFDEWAGNPYPEGGREEADKRLEIVMEAWGMIDKFKDGEQGDHWKDYWLFI